MATYSAKPCKCGRIHMVKEEDISKALEFEGELLLICGGCGNVRVIGGDKINYNGEKEHYNMYSYDLSEGQELLISRIDFEGERNSPHKKIYKIIYSPGIKIPMETGLYADQYFNEVFIDGSYPFLNNIDYVDIITKKVHDFIEDHRKKSTTVDMKRLIRENPKDQIEELSHYGFRAFNWKGTEFERK